MFTLAYFALILLIAEALPTPEYEVIYSNNGWIPLTSDQVYHQATPIIANNRHIDTDNDNNYLFSTEVATEKTVTHEITVKDRNEDSKCVYEDPKSCLYTKIQDVIYPNVETDFVPNVFKPDAVTNETSSHTGRRSKKISNIFTLSENKNMKSDIDTKYKEKSYEVTENNEFDVQNDATQGDGYFYQPPNNYTTKLFKLLSKYNIRATDDLPNYALSRRHKGYFPVKENVVLKPFDVQIPFRYNSLNHLPVDPLLAVLLSNYGYYIQGQYGIKNNYNNLYGYLASNNIHNNKPFGLYKVFSDTDSL